MCKGDAVKKERDHIEVLNCMVMYVMKSIEEVAFIASNWNIL